VGVAFHLVTRLVVHIFLLDLATVFLYLAFLLPFAQARAQDGPELAAPSSAVDPAFTRPARSASRKG